MTFPDYRPAVLALRSIRAFAMVLLRACLLVGSALHGANAQIPPSAAEVAG